MKAPDMSDAHITRPSAGLLPPELKDLREGELFVNELFLSIQGESTHAGRPCFFIRLAGCHLRCIWCDTEYAFHEGEKRTVEECLSEVERAGCPLVEVTGGEPLLQASVYPLMTALCDRGYEVLLETSGALAIDRVDPRVRRIVDWKTPASAMESHNHRGVPGALKRGDELKLVIQDRRDYEWARDWCRRTSLSTDVVVHFSQSFGQLESHDLARWILDDRLPVRLNLQLHKFIWSPDARGV
jgi:7-carboxy-7-deazaguanine synthase